MLCVGIKGPRECHNEAPTFCIPFVKFTFDRIILRPLDIAQGRLH